MTVVERTLVPFNRASFNEERTLEYVERALRSGHASGDGEFSRRCHSLLEEVLGVSRVLLTTSCTDALEMAAMLLEVKEGDEVVVPSFAFVTTANAFVGRGARPVFVDVREDTLNLDERLLEDAISERTKAVVALHYAGVGCEMDGIEMVARRAGVAVVEDNAHGLFGRYRGRYLGTLGRLATQSFHETKNFSCGEGGALLLNDESLVPRAEIIREKGTNRSRFFRGQVDKYTWVDVGSSYLPADLLAAVLLVQLEARDRIQERRREVWDLYDRCLRQWSEDRGIRAPFVPAHCEQAYHMYYLVLPSLTERDRFIAHLRARQVMAVFHYLPLHLSPMAKKWGYREGDFPVTESASDRLVRLPFFNSITDGELERVIEAVLSFVR